MGASCLEGSGDPAAQGLVVQAMPFDRERACDRGNGCFPAPPECSALKAGCGYGYRWISGPIATVYDEHKLPKATAATELALQHGSGSRKTAGQHRDYEKNPYSVRRQEISAKLGELNSDRNAL